MQCSSKLGHEFSINSFIAVAGIDTLLHDLGCSIKLPEVSLNCCRLIWIEPFTYLDIVFPAIYEATAIDGIQANAIIMSSANFNQHVLATVFEQGSYRPHVEQVQAAYRVKRDRMLAAR